MMSCRVIAGPSTTSRPVHRTAYSRSSFGGVTMPRTHLALTARQPSRNVTMMGLFGLGAPELAVIAGVVALIYGPSKLPELGKGLGKTMKSFKSAAQEFEKELKDGMADDEETKSEQQQATSDKK